MTSPSDNPSSADIALPSKSRVAAGRVLEILSILLALFGIFLTWQVSITSDENQFRINANQQVVLYNQELTEMNQAGIKSNQESAVKILESIDANTNTVKSNTESIDGNTESIAENQEAANAILQELGADQNSIRTDQAGIVVDQGSIRDFVQGSSERQDEIGRVLNSVEELTKDVYDLSRSTHASVSALDIGSDTPAPARDNSEPGDDLSEPRVHLSIGADVTEHQACPLFETCYWMKVAHSGLGEGPWEVKCATRNLARDLSNNVDPDEHEVWRIYETTFNPTNGCLFWRPGNTVYVIMNGVRSNDLVWNP